MMVPEAHLATVQLCQLPEVQEYLEQRGLTVAQLVERQNYDPTANTPQAYQQAMVVLSNRQQLTAPTLLSNGGARGGRRRRGRTA